MIRRDGLKCHSKLQFFAYVSTVPLELECVKLPLYKVKAYTCTSSPGNLIGLCGSLCQMLNDGDAQLVWIQKASELYE